MPEIRAEMRDLADTMQALFTPPDYVPGCLVKSLADKDEYTTNNGWIEAIVGPHGQQRVRYYGEPAGLEVDVSKIDVEYFPAYRLYRVFGSTLGGTAVTGGARVSEVWESDFGNIAAQAGTAGAIYMNDTANTKMTIGLTINQGANDDEALTLKSSDVAHGITTPTETDTYGLFAKSDADAGGLLIGGYRDADGIASRAIILSGNLGEAASTLKTTDAQGIINLTSRVKSGTDVTTVGADGNLVTIRSYDQTRLIIDAESTIHHVPGSDIDVDLATVQVTGTPTLSWDESEDSFDLNKGLLVNGNVGIGTTTPGATLDVAGIIELSGGSGNIRRNSASSVVRLLGATTTANGSSLEFYGRDHASLAGLGIITFGGYDGTGELFIRHVNTAGSFTTHVNVEANGDVGIGTSGPSAQLHVDQSSTTAAQPVLYLDQADVSEEMIEFNTTIGTGNAIEAVGAKTLTTTHFIKVTLPGSLTRYIPVGTIA